MYKQVVFIGRDYKASHNWNLEKDKVYDVIHESTYNYYIKNPIGGGQFAFAKNNFITTVKIDDAHMITFKSAQVICNLTEFTNRWRSNKLNELIDEN